MRNSEDSRKSIVLWYNLLLSKLDGTGIQESHSSGKLSKDLKRPFVKICSIGYLTS